MERESFDVTDYDPEENEWGSISDIVPHRCQMSGPSSPIYQIPMMYDSDDVEEHVITMVNLHENKVDPLSEGRSELEERRKQIASVSEQLKRLESLSTAKNQTRKRSKSTLKGLKTFIEAVDGGWITVERRFDKTTADTNGMLIRSKFGECIGINSKEFALELFDTLARRRYMRNDVIDKHQLREWWDLIIDQSFDSWLMLFFDMADKDEDGRLTQDEVREFISLIASANNLSAINEKAKEYAALIMEDFDSHGFGYIEVDGFEMLLMQLETECVARTSTAEETNKPMMSQRKPSKSCYRITEEISSSSLISCFKKRTSTTKKKP